MLDTETADFSEYRASYSPSFLAKVREKQRQAKIAEQTKALAERRREEQRLRALARLRREEDRKHRRTIQQAQEERRIEAADNAALDGLAAHEIIHHIASLHGVAHSEILGTSRKPHIVEARHHAMYEVRRNRPHLSLPQIGRIFGGRDHTVVLHACRKMEVRAMFGERSTQHKEG